ncbi:MAG TPA: hypothetical protein VMR95_03805 [Candidatus Binatia bacterium]|nr:hypothetical protein [Candidatus Binatia bacterium]
MSPKRNSRVLVLVIFVVLLVLIIVSVVLYNHSHNTGPGSAAYDATHQGPDHAGPPMVNIIGDTRLDQILLSGQFTVVMNELNSYILSNIGPKVVSAQISNTVINNDGSVNFTVQTNNPSSQFTVNLNRSQYTTIGFSVVGTSFQESLYPYGSN